MDVENVQLESEATTDTALRVGAPTASLSMRVLATLAVLTACYLARDVLIPVVLAILLALLLRPLVRMMRRLRLPDFVSSFVLIAVVALVFVVAVITLAGQAQQWLSEAPEMVQEVNKMLPENLGPLADFEKTKAAVKDLTEQKDVAEPVQVEMQSNDIATVLGVSGHFIGAAVVVFVLGFFLLALGDTLLKQAVESRPRFGEKRNIVELVQNVEQGISRYLVNVTLINIGLGVATALALWALRVPNPVLWGVLAGTSNYVPHVGAFVCMAVLFFVGAVSHESIGYGLLVAGTFAALTSAESYFVTPYVLSKSLQLSPLAAILAILFCGWMWGIAGGLMAAPLLAVLKITCDQFETLKGLRRLLSGDESPEPRPAPAESGSAESANRSRPVPAEANG